MVISVVSAADGAGRGSTFAVAEPSAATLGNSEARFDDTIKLLSVGLDDGVTYTAIPLAGVALADLNRSDFLWS